MIFFFLIREFHNYPYVASSARVPGLRDHDRNCESVVAVIEERVVAVFSMVLCTRPDPFGVQRRNDILPRVHGGASRRLFAFVRSYAIVNCVRQSAECDSRSVAHVFGSGDRSSNHHLAKLRAQFPVARVAVLGFRTCNVLRLRARALAGTGLRLLTRR